MNKEINELKKNTIIIAVANLGSKVISFILAPMYSYFMNTSQYGTIDLINSTIILIAPFIVLDIYDATFRFASDNSYNKSKVLSTSIATCIPSTILGLLFFVFGRAIPSIPSYLGTVSVCLFLTAINSVLSQYLRGSGKMVRFGGSGVVSSVFMLAANYVFLVHMHLGLSGWIFALLVSKIAESTYLLISSDIIHLFSYKDICKDYFIEFMHYCLPLLPTASMWWIMNLSDRYMLAFFVGTASTGLYAVASKLPSMLSILENIFYQAWQTTAINTLDNKEKDKIYSNVFNSYLSIMLIGLLGILIVGKPMIQYLFEKSYFEAYKFIPLLILAVVIHALAGNLGSLYSVFKSTRGALYSSIIGASINIVLNLIMIPIWGITGACLTTILGYCATLIYRIVDIKKFVNIQIEWKANGILIVTSILSFELYYIDGIFSYVLRIAMTLAMIFHYRKLLLRLLKK